MYNPTQLATRSMGQFASRSVTRSRAFTALALIALVGAAVVAPTTAKAAALPPEKALLGVHIFDRATLVLKKFGNPTSITTASGSTDTSAAAGTPGGASPAPVSSNGLPPMPSAPEFGGGQPGSPAGTSTTAAPDTPSTVTYVYVTKSVTIDFTVSPDGRVIQITVAGERNSNVRTSRGVTLGSPYDAVVAKYGFPETQDTAGGVLTAKYTDRAHVAFQFFNFKVVSITVAAVE
jgi:hypothetical protein